MLIVGGLFIYNTWIKEDFVFESPADATKLYCSEDYMNDLKIIHEYAETRNFVKEEENETHKTTYYTPESSDENETFKIHVRFDPNDLSVNGSNDYSYKIESAIKDLYKSAKKNGYANDIAEIDSKTKSNNISENDIFGSSNIDELCLLLYSGDGELIDSLNLTKGYLSIEKEDNEYVLRFESEKELEYASLTEKLEDESSSAYANLHMILKSNLDKSNPNYYCYDVNFPLRIEYQKTGSGLEYV